MKINFWDKLKTRLLIYCQLRRFPSVKSAFRIFINPIDSTREIEFSYLIKYLQQNNIKPECVLDISSPFVMAYVLSANSTVIKTDINPIEKEMIKKGPKLRFILEDATKLSFPDNSFDLVYSISVIEHIYEKYTNAINEMLRVLKPGGYMYLTFPVAKNHTEEWLDQRTYPTQYKNSDKAFFQYRFDENDVVGMLDGLNEIEIADMSIYWERADGEYDKTMKRLRVKPFNSKFTSLRNGLINIYSSIFLLETSPTDFSNAKEFGNISIMLRKKITHI